MNHDYDSVIDACHLQQSRVLDSPTFDLESWCISISGIRIRLRPQERKLLSLLLETPGSVVRSERLIQSLYGDIAADAGRVRLKRLVADIRSRLRISDRLRTIHKVGLVLDMS
jgi:DNA-binding winged helix-turn-helix (wHTH) protein